MFKLVSEVKNNLLVLFLPQNRGERRLFWGLLLFYFTYSLFFVFKTSIIDNTVVEADLYFSFDNPLILKYARTQISGHPLIFLFYYPFVLLGNLLASLITFKAKTILFVLLSSSMISLSCVYIYRYLKEIVELKTYIALMLALFFAFFSTCLILSFTSESFTLSLFLLSFNVYFFSKNIKENKTPSFLSTVFLSISLGGTTITNFSKGVLPILFLNDKFWNKLKKVFVLGGIFLIILYLIHLTCIIFLDKDFFKSIIDHRNNFILPHENTSYFTLIFDHFFGAPIFFPELRIFHFAHMQGTAGFYDIYMVKELDYNYWWQYTFVSVILLSLIVSIIRNLQNRFVLLICSLFIIDIIIHCVLRFGLGLPFIYGGHWIYCIPLLLGWLIKGFNGISLKISIGILITLFLGLLVNNTIRMIDFSKLVLEIYPLEP